MTAPLIVLVAVAPVIAPERFNVETLLIAVELMTMPLIVLLLVGAVIALEVTKAPVVSKYDCLVGVPVLSNISNTFAEVPVVPFTVKATVLFAIGLIVFAAVVVGTFTKKSVLVISPLVIVANAGAPPVVARKYCPVVPLVILAKLSAVVV